MAKPDHNGEGFTKFRLLTARCDLPKCLEKKNYPSAKNVATLSVRAVVLRVRLRNLILEKSFRWETGRGYVRSVSNYRKKSNY